MNPRSFPCSGILPVPRRVELGGPLMQPDSQMHFSLLALLHAAAVHFAVTVWHCHRPAADSYEIFPQGDLTVTADIEQVKMGD